MTDTVTYFSDQHLTWLSQLKPNAKLGNANPLTGDMDMDRCCEMTSMVYADNVTVPRSTEVIRRQ